MSKNYCVLYPVLSRMMNPDDVSNHGYQRLLSCGIFIYKEDLLLYSLNPCQCSATTLMVYGVPLHACEDDVRESFSSFGEIECVEMERESISQTAYVTYKDSEAAKFAIDLVNPQVCNLDVRVWYILYYRTLSESKYIKAKPSEELFISMREKALKKYSEIIACHAKLQTKDVEAELQANDAESVLKNDADDICGSMAFEGLAIGKAGLSPEHH